MKRVILILLLIIGAFSLSAQQVELDLSLTNPYLMDRGTQTNYVRVGLTGFQMESRGERPVVNTAIVLDKSGSMGGEKIRQAKRAAKTAVDMLENGDIVSLIVYSDDARVLVPATVLNRSSRKRLHHKINSIEVDGSTALFSGVVAGADQLEEFYDEYRVNRVILLSDGLANIGPDSPAELGNLGRMLGGKGISVTTIGLGDGYNADLMYALAASSDGNHAFVQEPEELVSIFEKEFHSLMTVVAQDVRIRLKCAPGIRPMRIMNREGEVYSDAVVLSVNQIYSQQEQYAIIEVEVDPRIASADRPAAEVSVDYLNMKSQRNDSLGEKVAIAFTASEEEVDRGRDDKTLADVTLQIATERNEEAMELREKGKVQEAEKLLEENAVFLKESVDSLDLAEEDEAVLEEYAAENLEDAEGVTADDYEWEIQKKSMRERQHSNRQQQVY